MKAILYFAPLFGRLRAPLVLTVALSLVTLAAGIGLLGISGWFLTAAALSTAGAAFNLFAPSAGVRGLSFVRILSRYGEKVTGHDATLRLLSDLRRTTFSGLFRLVPLGRLYGRADLVSRLVADLDALDTIFLVGIGPILTAVVAGGAMTVLLAFVLPTAAPIYGAGFLLAAIAAPAILIVASRHLGSALASSTADLRAAVLDALAGHQDLVLFGAVAATQTRAAAAIDRLADSKRRMARATALTSAAVQALAGAILVATLVCGLVALDAGMIDGPVLVGLLLAVLGSFEASAVVIRSAGGVARAAAAAERLAGLAQRPAAIAEPSHPSSLPEGGEVAFEDVGFGYDGRTPILEGLNLRIASGECVALKGPSGAGKSTIAQLLVRLVDPRRGTIRINGRDIREAGSEALRQRVVLMTQDAPVFNDTVRANLTLGSPGATDDELWAILDRVRLGEAVRSLPRQLDALLGENGAGLSVGQARRICLARTLLSPASIVVLDEPTTGLDHETERLLLEDIPTLADGRTMIVITHTELPAAFGRVLQLRAGRLI